MQYAIAGTTFSLANKLTILHRNPNLLLPIAWPRFLEIGILFEHKKPAKAQKVTHLVAKGPTHAKSLFFVSYDLGIVRSELSESPRFLKTLRQGIVNMS